MSETHVSFAGTHGSKLQQCRAMPSNQLSEMQTKYANQVAALSGGDGGTLAEAKVEVAADTSSSSSSRYS